MKNQIENMSYETRSTASSPVRKKIDIISEINELSCMLAVKELADLYDKKTCQLTNKNGDFLPEYQDRFNDLFDKYEAKLIELTGRSADEIFND